MRACINEIFSQNILTQFLPVAIVVFLSIIVCGGTRHSVVALIKSTQHTRTRWDHRASLTTSFNSTGLYAFGTPTVPQSTNLIRRVEAVCFSLLSWTWPVAFRLSRGILRTRTNTHVHRQVGLPTAEIPTGRLASSGRQNAKVFVCARRCTPTCSKPHGSCDEIRRACSCQRRRSQSTAKPKASE